MRFVHFAGDTTVFASGNDINNVRANLELVRVDNWLKVSCQNLEFSLNPAFQMFSLLSQSKDNKFHSVLLLKMWNSCTSIFPNTWACCMETV